MRQRYYLKDPDGKIVYETESLPDAERFGKWRLATIGDVLHDAGWVSARGDNERIQAIAFHMMDHFAAELGVVDDPDHFLRPPVRSEMYGRLVELTEIWLVRVATASTNGH